MSALSDHLSTYPTSLAVAEDCEAYNLDLSALACRLQLDRPPFMPCAIKTWAEQNPTITAEDFVAMDEATRDEIAGLITEGVRRHAPHLWAAPLPEGSYDDLPRTVLFLDPRLAGITPLDEVYRLTTPAALAEWLAPYRDVMTYAVDFDDCDDKGDRIRGYKARCAHPRPSIGTVVITGVKNGIGQGHVLNFHICVTGEFLMIDNDGSLYPFQGGRFNDWDGVAIQGGWF